MNIITDKPLVVTLGDPCGIGPEIIAKSWKALREELQYSFAVIGDKAVFAPHNIATQEITSLTSVKECFSQALPILHRPLSNLPIPGNPSTLHSQHIISWIDEAFSLTLKKTARAMITAPIAKSIVQGHNFQFAGHTEYLAELSSKAGYPTQPIMVLKTKDLMVALATIHISVNSVSANLTTELIITICELLHNLVHINFGIMNPRIAIAALNPHAGEDGNIGREEIEVIIPAINFLKNKNINISGPHPADTLFHDEARQKHDIVLCMYHDQALIPLKTIDFWNGVNITLNLPIVRTSPDHGTGFDITGKNIARPNSMIEAIKTAHALSLARKLI